MMNPPAVECFATDSISALEKAASGKLHNFEDQCEVQLWRYNPRKLATGNSVDRLSLALALDKDRDERNEKTQAELAKEISITPSYVNRLIRKNENVVNKTFLAMMEALGYDVTLVYEKREK